MVPEASPCWIAENSIALISSSTPSFSAIYLPSSISEPTYSTPFAPTFLNSMGAKSGAVPMVIFPEARIFPRRLSGSTSTAAPVASASLPSPAFSVSSAAAAVPEDSAFVSAAVSLLSPPEHPVIHAMDIIAAIATNTCFFIFIPLFFILYFIYAVSNGHLLVAFVYVTHYNA